ncbi:hypothetical protein B0H11DRAFT_2229101 [Mycena galericulata]|nr:hypothetical protein B0H11DRAFT_2229101 [Mycena galericulata]
MHLFFIAPGTHMLVVPHPAALFRRGEGEAGGWDTLVYKAASDVAVTELPPTHSIRFGLDLDFSAFDDAMIVELSTSSEESYKDSTFIVQLLRDNLNLWIFDMQDSGS